MKGRLTMKTVDSASILASFATLKTLSDGKKYNSSYQLLSEFIHYIIYTENLFSFAAIDMKAYLKNIFGFEIPEAVVKTASKSLIYLSRKNGVYTVEEDKFVPDQTLEKAKNKDLDTNSLVINELEKYILEVDPDEIINREQLTRDIMSFLVDENPRASGRYYELISEFILKKEDDITVQECFRKIREGSILYIGITHNINETGNFQNSLTLYLDTEILFSLAGYNGEIYKTLAYDFYNQVKSANLNGEKIRLTYFPEVEREVEDYFTTASSIVERTIPVINKPAMAAIINGCKTSADVDVKRADFFHTLNYSLGIHKDKKVDYYTQEDIPFNLESLEHTDPKDQESWRFISHINKLRKAKYFSDYADCKYLFITNTNHTLRIAREYTEKVKAESALEFIVDNAINLDKITNIIWYKLGNGFSKKEYPSNVSAILKARIVLSTCINHNVESVYSEIKEQYRNGKITEEQLASRIITLKRKPSLPEEIEGDSIEESMDFSPEYLSRFEEEVKTNKTLLQEKNQIIQDLKEQNQSNIEKRDGVIAEKDLAIAAKNDVIAAKDEIIAEKDLTIETQREQNLAMAAELEIYHKKDQKSKRRKALAKKIILFVWSIVWKLLIIAGITVLAVYLKGKFDSDIPMYVCYAIDIISIALTAWKAFEIDFKKHFLSGNK